MASMTPEVRAALIQAQDLFVWEAPSFRKHQRSSSWYFGLTVISILLIAYALMTSNFLFAFIIILTVMLLLLMNSKEPRTVLVQFGQEGMVWDGVLYLYEDLEQFAIVYNPPVTKALYIDFKSSVRPRLVIPLQDQDPVEIRTFLSLVLPENPDLRSEPFSGMIGRLLKL